MVRTTCLFMLIALLTIGKGVRWRYFPNSHIDGHNIDIRRTGSIEACKKECLRSVSPKCRSIDVGSGICALNDVTTATTSLSSGNTMDYYEVIQAEPEDSWFLKTKGKLPPTSPAEARGVNSKIQCAAWCKQAEDCLAFSFNKGTKVCQIFDDDVGEIDGTWTNQADVMVYLRRLDS